MFAISETFSLLTSYEIHKNLSPAAYVLSTHEALAFTWKMYTLKF